jgi:superfamily II DNA helicase RecQ
MAHFGLTTYVANSSMLCFIQTICQLVVEPLRALIFSQIKELTQRKVCVTRLLSRDEANAALSREDGNAKPDKLYGPDYLWHLVRHYNNTEMPLIIFSTPELLSTCTGEKGPIQALAVEKKMSLIVLDEFDYIDECHHQYRNAYTTIVPDLKRSVVQWHVPFLYLSATGSNYRMHDVLFTISNPYTEARPLLVQTDQILPQNHIYKGMNVFLNFILLTTF